MTHRLPASLRAVAPSLVEKLRPIRLVLLDVDGVLTDGRILYVGGDVGWSRTFHVHDGFGIKRLLRRGLHVGVISADDNPAMSARIKMLGIPHAWLGSEDKGAAFDAAMARVGASESETLFVGDEVYDAPLILRAGFGATVPDGCPEALAAADYVTQKAGGYGAVRELCELLLFAQED